MTDQGGIGSRTIFSPPPWWTPMLDSGEGRALTTLRGRSLLVISEDGEDASLFGEFLAAGHLCHRAAAAAACGECVSCQSLLEETHGDFLRIRRQEGKTVIGIEQIRAGTRFVQLTALYGDSKVLLIEAADRMTLEAANSLLKTLEEPVGSTLVILASSAVWRLPATVRSRCQRVMLPRPRHDEAVSWLAEQLGCDASDASNRLAYTRDLPIAAWATSDSIDTALCAALSRSFDDISTQRAVPTVWSDISAEALLDCLLLWVESQARGELSQNALSDGASWLALHRCIAQLSGRVKLGAAPNQEILMTEVYRLCRSRSHPAFDELATRFLSGLDILGHAG